MTAKTQRTTIINGCILAVTLVILFSVGSKVFSVVADHSVSPDIRILITRVIFWGCCGIIYLYAVKTEKQPFLLWSEHKYDFSFYVASIVILLLIIVFSAITLGLSLNYLGLLRRSEVFDTIIHLSVPVKLFTAITAGLAEELIFRGYLMPRLQLLFNNKHLTVILTAVVFGAIHFAYGTVVNVLNPIMIGLVFGYHYFKYRNLKILIICHTLIDLNALFISALLKHH